MQDAKAFGSPYIDPRLDSAGHSIFDSLSKAFARALSARPDELVARTFRIAGEVATVRVVGRALAAELLSPFAHLALVDAGVDAQTHSMLRVDAWDQHATQVACDAVPVDPEASNLGIVIRSRNGRHVRLERPLSSMWLDLEGPRMIGWFADARLISIEERSKPFYRLLCLWLAARGITMIHSGAIKRNGKGVLLTGKGGAGKSTSVLSALLAGFEFVGDDYVGLRATLGGPCTVSSLFSTCSIHIDRTSSFPSLRALMPPPNHTDEEKLVIRLGEAFRDRMVGATSISAILLPRLVAGSMPSLQPASRVDALRALAPSSILLMPNGSAEAFGAISNLVDSVPAYWLDLAGPIESVPSTIAAFIQTSTT